jgi:polar amino acid transport system permease protein
VRREVGTWPAFLAALLIYFVIAWVVSLALRGLEARAQRRLGLGDFEVRKARQDADKVMAGAAADDQDGR